MTAWPLFPSALTLRLVTVEPAPGQAPCDVVDPFVVLNDRGGFSRVLLAEIVGPEGRPVLPVALKVQSDEYPLLGDESDANPAIDARWRREIAVLERCGGQNGLPGLLEALPRSEGSPAHLPPTIYCKERTSFFVARCPGCGGQLSDVRDNRLLENRELPRHDLSLVRFVGCAPCLAAHPDGPLWTLVLEGSYEGKGVGDQADYFRRLAPLARTLPVEAEAAIPCQGCDSVAVCHPAAGAEPGRVVRNLTPVAFFQSHCVALDLQHLRYDESVALLGRTPFGTILAEAEAPRRRFLERLTPQLNPTATHLFAHDPVGRLGLEVLRVKVGLFARVCRAVATLHRATRMPHLSLTPASVMIRVPAGSGELPSAWSLEVALGGLGNVEARRLPAGDPDDLPAPSFRPPRSLDPVFAPAALRARPLRDAACVLAPTSVTPAAGGRFIVEAVLECESLERSALSEKDVMDVTVVQGRPPLSLTIVGTPVIGDAEVRLRSVPLELTPAIHEALVQLRGQRLARARLSVYPCLHVGVDVFSLGMMLATSLLGNAVRPAAEVAADMNEVASRLTQAALDTPDLDATSLTACATALIRQQIERRLGRERLFADPEEGRAAAEGVPLDLWIEALMLPLRAITMLNGFSICRHPGDFDLEHPEVKVEFLLQLTQALLRRVDGVLFGLPGRTQTIRRALARIGRELDLDDPIQLD